MCAAHCVLLHAQARCKDRAPQSGRGEGRRPLVSCGGFQHYPDALCDAPDACVGNGASLDAAVWEVCWRVVEWSTPKETPADGSLPQMGGSTKNHYVSCRSNTAVLQVESEASVYNLLCAAPCYLLIEGIGLPPDRIEQAH